RGLLRNSARGSGLPGTPAGAVSARGTTPYAVGRNCAFFVLSAKAGGTTLVSNRYKGLQRGCPMIRMILAVLVRMMLVVIALAAGPVRSEEHTSELQSRFDLVCRLLLEKKNT